MSITEDSSNQVFAKIVTESTAVKTDIAKKYIIWLFQQATEHGQDVAMFFPKESQLGTDITFGIHDLDSSTGATDLFAKFAEVGIKCDIRSGCSEMFGGSAAWVFPNSEVMADGYGKRVLAAKKLTPDVSAINSIQLS